MKKIRNIILTTFIFCLLSCSAAMAADWSIYVNDQKLDAEVKIIDGRSLIPLRAVGEALGLDVGYNGELQQVMLVSMYDKANEKFDGAILIHLDKGTLTYAVDHGAYAGAESDVPLEVPPVNVNSRLYVPVRLICNIFGAPVDVDGTKIKIGSIYTTGKIMSIDSLKKQATPVAKPENKDTFDKIQVGLTQDGVTIADKKNQEKEGLLNLVYLKINGRTVVVAEDNFYEIRNKYGMKGFKTFYDDAIFEVNLDLVDPVSAVYDSDIPNVNKHGDIMIMPDGRISVMGWVYASNRMGGKVLKMYSVSFDKNNNAQYVQIM